MPPLAPLRGRAVFNSSASRGVAHKMNVGNFGISHTMCIAMNTRSHTKVIVNISDSGTKKNSLPRVSHARVGSSLETDRPIAPQLRDRCLGSSGPLMMKRMEGEELPESQPLEMTQEVIKKQYGLILAQNLLRLDNQQRIKLNAYKSTT